MVTAKILNKNHARQRGLPTLLSGLIAGMLLTFTALAQAADDGEPLHGFLDVGYSTHSRDANNNPSLPRGFNVGSLDIYLTPQFDSNVKALIELIFETPSEGGIATDLERAQIGYLFSDNATVWAGRFHTPYGYWNNGFHHGSQFQTSVSRPRFLDFEDKGGILPAHMVGLWGTGKIGAGAGKFTYDVYAGNGPAIAVDPVAGTAELDIQTSGDNNHQAMVGMNLGYEFSGMADGLRLAVHALNGDVEDNVAPTFNVTELSMAGGSVVYLTNEWEVLGEYYRFSNKDKSGATGTHTSWADYLQVGRNFDGLTPYLRAEKTVLSQLDNYFIFQDSGQSYDRQALGLKYDLNPKAALKFELQNSKFAAETGRTAYKYRSFLAQYAIRF
ncbi:MAG: hypothetical protein ACOY9D_03925 [Pseudomonadota bacterium]